MQIQKINLFAQNNKIQLQEHKNQTVPQAKPSNLPMMAYKDYNISFGERLFRTPANFFEQDFNRQNMPVTMKRYLFADYEDRQNMPPNQMLKLVFDDINLAKNLEEVQYLYPDEPLFENLSDNPKIKARTGIIAEIETMREDGKTLFKNGQDNLGFYILKKIYLEGKSLKEINNDFNKDISVYYKGLSPIQYETLFAYGIKFPKGPFWKSFTATREDFPYEYKPRKPIEERINSERSAQIHGRIGVQKPAKGKFEEIKDWQIDKLSDAMIEGNGSKEQTRRSLKRHSAGDPEALNFVAKYMGEINSVVLEKLHVSEEMKDFFENYDNLTDSQKVKFKKYWDNPEIKDLRSLVMSSTIKFFFDVYGVDGNNDEFQELLEYAHNIKAERLKREEEHNRLQAEYEELFVNYCPAEEPAKAQEELPVVPPLTPSEHEVFNSKMTQKARDLNAMVYPFELSSGTTISVVANYDQMLRDKLAEDMSFYPKSFRDDYRRFIQKKSAEYPNYLMSLFFNARGLEDLDCVLSNGNAQDPANDEQFDLFKKEYLMPIDEVNALSVQFNEEYNDKHELQCNAINQVLNELLIKVRPTPERYEELTHIHEDVLQKENPEMNAEEIHKQAMKDVKRVTDKYIGKQIAAFPINELQSGLVLFDVKPNDVQLYIENRYSLYNQPLTPRETQKVSKALINRIMNYDANNSVMDDLRTQAIMKCVSENLKSAPKLRNAFADTLAETLSKKHGDFRAFLLSDNDKDLLDAKAEIFFIKYLNKNQSVMYPLMAVSQETLEKYIAPVDRNLYNHIMQYRVMQSIRY